MRLILSDSTKRSRCKIVLDYKKDCIKVQTLTVDEEEEDVFLGRDSIRFGEEHVHAHFKHIPVLKNRKGLLADIVDTVVAMKDVSSDFVQLFDDLVFTDCFFVGLLALCQSCQTCWPRYCVRRHISAFVFEFFACKLDQRIVNTVAGDDIDNFLVLFIAAKGFSPLLRIIEQVAHLQSRAFLCRARLRFFLHDTIDKEGCVAEIVLLSFANHC